jgi:subtilisin family serine protease
MLMSTKRLSALGIVMLLSLALGVTVPGHAAAAGPYIIGGAGGSLPANLGTMVGAAGGSLTRTLPEIGVAQATASDPSFATKMAGNSGIQYVVQDSIVQWTPPPSAMQGSVALPAGQAAHPNPQGAFFYACQWGLPQIDAPGAWAQGAFGSPHVKVAVLDTGVDPNHIDLAGKIDTNESTSKLTPGSSPCGSADETTFFDFDFHGTFVSSQITGNLIGMAAVAPKTSVVMVKVLSCVGSGSFGDVIAGIHYAAGLEDVDVINMSLGAYFPRAGNDSLIDAMDRAVTFAKNRGKLVVSAAGNNGAQLGEGSPNIEVPGQSKGGIGIYATTINQQLASYSNFGEVTWVGAPGGDLPDPVGPLPGCPINPSLQSLVLGACSSALCGGENFYLIGAGTSFASPIVAAVAALVDSVRDQGDTNPGHVKHVLASTAQDLKPHELFSNGLVDASSAVRSQRQNGSGGDE